MKPRYLVLCLHTGNLLSWDYDEIKANAVRDGLIARNVPAEVKELP